MKSSIEKLQKFFRLEAERDYDNKAVMGGLQGMLESWQLEARADELPEELIQAVVIRLRDYHRLSETSRKETLHGIWARVQRETGSQEPVSDPTSPAKPQPEPQTTETAAPTTEQSPTAEPESPPDLLEKKSQTRKKRTREYPEGPTAALNANVTVLPRLGERKAKTLRRIGIRTLGDMLYYFPWRYDDYSQLTPINRLKYNQKTTIIGTVQSVSSRKIRGGNSTLIEAVVSDGTAAIKLTWFISPGLQTRSNGACKLWFQAK